MKNYGNHKKPVVSIVMPVYNDRKYLDEAIQGILNQTFKDFELILVNDASTDNSLEIMKKYQKKDKRIIIINNKKNLMTSRSRNKALKIAKGKYIGLQDGDDVSLPERLENQVNFLEKNKDVFMAVCLPIFVNEYGKTNYFSSLVAYSLKVIYFFIKDFSFIEPRINLIVNSCMMFRNTGEYFYRPNILYTEDYDFTLRLISDIKKISCVNKYLVKYRISDSMVSARNTDLQHFFDIKSREFYFQRIKSGKDDYGDIDINFQKKIKGQVHLSFHYLLFKMFMRFVNH